MHDESLISLIVFVIIGLVVLNALSYYSERFMVLPNVVWILLFGMLYGAFKYSEILNLPAITLDPNIILFVLVPILIFASSKNMCLYRFRRVLKSSTILATLGIIISMVCVALILYFAFHVPILEALLFGVIVSATDPIAVGAILQDAEDISEYKKMLIEGESILNDGFVVAVFAALSVIVFGAAEISLTLSGGKLVLNIGGALVLGIVLGRIARFLLRIWQNPAPALTINITIALAFASFLIAETLHLPGVLAVFAGALAFGYRPDEDNENIQDAQQHVWDYLEYIVNAILFFLLGTSFFTLPTLGIITVSFIVLVIIMLFVSRFVALGILKPFLRVKGKKLTQQDFWLLNFSGSRGAISIALVLLLPDTFMFKPLFLTIASVMVLVSLVAYPLILKKILSS